MQGEDEFTFWHILVRDVAYGQIPRAQRAERHLKAAGWIERAAGDRVGDHADILAHHYLQAVELGGGAADPAAMRSSAGHYLFLAGERAVQLDVTRAERLYGQALELLTPDDRDYPEARVSRALVLFGMGRHAESIAEFESARATFAERGEVVRAAFAMSGLAMVLRHRNEMERGRQLAIEARAMLETQPPGPELVRVIGGMAGDAMLRSQYAEASELAQQAIDLAERIGRPDLTVRPLQYRGWGKWDQRDVAGAQSDLQTAIELGLASGYPGDVAVAYNNYAGMRWMSDGPAAGLETYREGIAFSTRRGMDGPRIWSTAESLWCLYDLGRWDELLALADEMRAEAEARTWSQITSFSEIARAKVLFHRGAIEEARTASATNMPKAREVDDPQLVIPALELQALIEEGSGNGAEAVRALEEVERITADTSPLVLSGGTHCIPVACRAGDPALGRRLADVNPAMPGRQACVVAHGRAAIAEAEERLDDAATGFADAAARWAAYGSVVDQGLALIGQGRCLVALGREQEAVEPLQAARAILAGFGAVRSLAESDDLLAQATARAG
jgi:tetratricopeptide (TPR) repeat protein